MINKYSKEKELLEWINNNKTKKITIRHGDLKVEYNLNNFNDLILVLSLKLFNKKLTELKPKEYDILDNIILAYLKKTTNLYKKFFLSNISGFLPESRRLCFLTLYLNQDFLLKYLYNNTFSISDINFLRDNNILDKIINNIEIKHLHKINILFFEMLKEKEIDILLDNLHLNFFECKYEYIIMKLIDLKLTQKQQKKLKDILINHSLLMNLKKCF